MYDAGLQKIFFAEKSEAIGRKDLFTEVVVGYAEYNVCLFGIVGNESIKIIETEVFGADRLEEFSETALGVGDFRADDVGDINDLAVIGKSESSPSGIVYDEAENTEALGLGNAECADIDIIVSENLGDFIYGAGFVFGEY